jgi:hypothetical protein
VSHPCYAKCLAMRGHATHGVPETAIVAVDWLSRKTLGWSSSAGLAVNEPGGEVAESGKRAMVVEVRVAGGQTIQGVRLVMACRDDDGELPDEGQQARLRRHFEVAALGLTEHKTAIDIVVRPWEPDDGGELMSWKNALRRLDLGRDDG